MRKIVPCLLLIYAMTCCSASADSVFKFEATVFDFFSAGMSGFDVNAGDTISGTFGYGTPGQSDPFIQALINGVEYSSFDPSFYFHADFLYEGVFRGIGDINGTNAQMGIFMQGSGQTMIEALTGCNNFSDCPALDGLPASFPFLDQGAAQLQIRSGDGHFGFPIDLPGGSPYYLNANISSIAAVPEPPTFALLIVGLVSFLWLRTRSVGVRIS
jgi:hypothetical protein